jgi:urocanate hydratase
MRGHDRPSERLRLALTNDTTTGLMRYADAGYEESFEETAVHNIRHFRLPAQ